MLEDEIKEKEATMIEILARLNLQDKKIQERVKSKEYQSLIRKTFREWSGAESEEKRKFIRNILSNAAATDLTSDEKYLSAIPTDPTEENVNSTGYYIVKNINSRITVCAPNAGSG